MYQQQLTVRYHSRSKGGIVFSSVRLCVYLSVNKISPEPLEISSGHHHMVERADTFENVCRGARVVM